MTDWLNKKQMRRSFNAAASTYDKAAELQRQVADLLLKNIPNTKNKTTLDIGSGTGYISEQLKNTSIVSVDIAEKMLSYSKQKQTSQYYCCSDAESLSFLDNSIDIIVSSMSLHWCQNIKEAFSEISRILKPEATIFFAILGENSLHELRHCWDKIDKYQHVNPFPNPSSLQKMLTPCFSKINLETHTITRYHETIYKLMKKLKDIGAHNVTKEKPSGLTGKEKLRVLENAYEAYRNQDHMLPATYEIIIGVCEK